MTHNSGSVVAYKLSMALLKDIENDSLKEELLLIASCGAIADVVSLIGENRSMVHCALELLNSKKEKLHKGIYKLLSQNVSDRNITSTDIAFILAPRINAVGRLFNASLSFEFLTTEDDNKLDFIIEKLNNYNAIRQSKCTETYDEIKNYLNKNKDEANKPAIILINEDWHIGIIGIVAAKIVEEYQKPCFLMTVDENNNARCSIRSNDSINVYDVLKENQDLFLGFGGHKLAGGCSFNLSERKFEDIKKALLKTIKETTNNDIEENVLYADVQLEPDDLELNIFETLDKLEPYGQDNPFPVFAMFDVSLEEIKLIGKEQNHLRLTISKNGKKFSCLKWNDNEMLIPLNSKCDIAFFPRINTFNETTLIQLEIIDMYSPNVVPKNSAKNEIKLFDHRKKDGILEKIAQYLKDKEFETGVWAKTQQSKEKLAKYNEISSKIIQNYSEFKEILFFDYPSNEEEFIEILNEIQPTKVHFMKTDIDENIDNYIKQLNGMIKYCLNKMNGEIDIKRMSLALGVSENFVQLSFEILENIEAIKFIENNKIADFKIYTIENFKSNSMYELLNEEFENILNYKKSMLACDFKDIESLIMDII